MYLTLITASRPPRLSKAFRLGASGHLEKLPGGQLMDGIAERLSPDNIDALARILENLTPANALCYGITQYPVARLVPERLLSTTAQDGGPPVIARTRRYFRWPDGPAVMMLDYDPPADRPPLAPSALLGLLYAVVPALQTAPHLVTHSASTFIFHGDYCLRGRGGLKVLLPVAQGRDIPRAGDALFKRLWLAGHGFIQISQAGSLLIRGPIDTAVWQPEHCDFPGGAACEPPLEQCRPAPLVVDGDGRPLDTSAAIPSLSLAEEAHHRRLLADAKNGMQSQAMATRRVWIETQVTEHIKRVPTADAAEIRSLYTRAVEGDTLRGEFTLYPADAEPVTVAEVLADPETWHGRRCADPLEPTYRDDPRIAFLNLRSGRPFLFSHAHGGRKFHLIRSRPLIRLVPGQREAAVEDALGVLRAAGTHFDHGGETVVVTSDGRIVPRDAAGIAYDLDCACRFEQYDGRSSAFVVCDCRPAIAKGLVATPAGALPRLASVSTAPLYDPATDRILDTEGWDSATGIYVSLADPEGWPSIPARPTDRDLAEAVRTLWAPFAAFPFDGRVSKGVWLSAVLSAAVRPCLPTAPAVAITSPVAGSGKTLLAKCISELTGETPAVFSDTSEEDENRKRFLSFLRTGGKCLVLDNVTRPLRSASLCAVITTEVFQGRLLGENYTLRVPTRTVVLITGNNLVLQGDLCRRVLTARIDPQMEIPWLRKFADDPAFLCRRDRARIITAANTILRAGVQRGPELQGSMASFEAWSNSVRRAVVMVGYLDLLDVDDPVLSIEQAHQVDPDTQKLAALLAAWHKAFGDKATTVAEVIKAAMNGYAAGDQYTYMNPDLHDAVTEIAQQGRTIEPRILGWWLRRNQDRIVDGRKVARAGTGKPTHKWRVQTM